MGNTAGRLHQRKLSEHMKRGERRRRNADEEAQQLCKSQCYGDTKEHRDFFFFFFLQKSN